MLCQKVPDFRPLNGAAADARGRIDGNRRSNAESRPKLTVGAV
jgi:hypothetical protein